MRRIALLVICLSMLIALIGCGQLHTSSEIKQEEIETTKQGEKTDNKKNEGTPISIETKSKADDNSNNEQSIPNAQISWTNYSENSRIIENCLNSTVISETMHLSSVRHLPLFRFESKSDIDMFITDYSDIFSFHEGYNEIPSFNEIISTYDEDYFSEHCLMCVYLVASSGSFRYGVKNIKNDNSLFCINVEQTNNPEVYTEDMAGWFILVEVNKSDIQDCTEYDALFVGVKEVEITEQHPGMIEYGSFSYKEMKNSIDMNAISVKTEGFVNVEEVEMGLPIDRAKLEVTVDYDLVQTYYDSVEDVWMVHFFNSKWAGADETVFLNGKGVTLLILFGE